MPLDYPQRRQNLVYGGKSGFIGYLMIRPPGPWRMYWKTLEGLVLRYDFNQCQAIDLSGHGNNGTIYGAQCVEGRSGKALSFDGVDDYVDCGNGESLNITDEITIIAWINPCSFHSGDIIRKEGAYVVRTDEKGAMYFFLHIGGSWLSCYSSDRYSTNHWEMWAFRYDGTHTKIYKDGSFDKECSITGSIDITTNPLNIGGCYYYFNGAIDEVRIYNRALSEEEIKWLYEHT